MGVGTQAVRGSNKAYFLALRHVDLVLIDFLAYSIMTHDNQRTGGCLHSCFQLTQTALTSCQTLLVKRPRVCAASTNYGQRSTSAGRSDPRRNTKPQGVSSSASLGAEGLTAVVVAETITSIDRNKGFWSVGGTAATLAKYGSAPFQLHEQVVFIVP